MFLLGISAGPTTCRVPRHIETLVVGSMCHHRGSLHITPLCAAASRPTTPRQVALWDQQSVNGTFVLDRGRDHKGDVPEPREGHPDAPTIPGQVSEVLTGAGGNPRVAPFTSWNLIPGAFLNSLRAGFAPNCALGRPPPRVLESHRGPRNLWGSINTSNSWTSP